MTVKDTLADLGIDICIEFCELNGIRKPKLNIYRDVNEPMSRRIKAWATCGFYRSDNIHVSVPLCAHTNAMYSWPAFISDRTPLGVIQHELGHHVDEVFSGFNIYKHQPQVTMNNLPCPGEMFSDKIRKLSGEDPITSYCPNTMEWFAEIFRLFVTNPVLLAKIRPRAYDALTSHGLIPVSDLDEVQTLQQFQAPARVFERMEKWIQKSK